MALPLLALWLFVAHPQTDAHWQHNPSHFFLVNGAAAVSAVVALQIRRDARRRSDARLELIALSFFAAAGFLLVHGLTTPGVLVEGRTSAFVLAAPVGLLIAALFAAAASLELPPAQASAVTRAGPALTALIVLAVAILSLAPLAGILSAPIEEEAEGITLAGVAILGVTLFLVAAARFFRLYRRRPAVMLVSLITAYALLAEALVTVFFARSWALSWWQWHVLMLVAFAFVAYSARVQHRREGSPRGLFAGVALAETVRDIEEEHRTALAQLVESIQGGASADELAPVAARLAARYDLTDAQAAVLRNAAQATAEVEALRQQLDALLHLYISPEVADRLIDDPAQAELGGTTAEVTVLFADLRGFTPFAERAEPAAVVELLNRYFRRVVPIILDQGGTVVQFVGDEIMAVFNAPEPLDDHPARAAAAALAIQRSVEEEAAGQPDLPRFRIGINSGPALVGNIGGQVRNFTAIGDTTNLASRLEGLAEPGQIVIGATTYDAIRDHAVVEPLGLVRVKGKSRPVEAYVLVDLHQSAQRTRSMST